MCLDPDSEFRDFVVNTLKSSGYDLSEFGLVDYYTKISPKGF